MSRRSAYPAAHAGGGGPGARWAPARRLAWAALAAITVLGPAGGALAEEPTAAQIVERNVAARGGIDAWRKVQTMAWSGHMEGGDLQVAAIPFVLEQKRPNKTHFEINQMGQRSLRVFDGLRGWKVRPGQGGRPEVLPFTLQEVKFAREGQGIDGPLIDYQARGNAVSLGGVEEVEGRKTYRLDVRLASGEVHHVWVDAGSFLELKSDRISYTPDGRPVTVTLTYRDYRDFEGLQLPTRIETGAAPGRAPERMVIERVALNFPLDDERSFGKPGAPHKHGTAHAGAGSAAGAAGASTPPVAPPSTASQDPGSRSP